MAGEIFVLGVVVVFAVNVLLYYRYRDLRDQAEEKRSAEREKNAHAIASRVTRSRETASSSTAGSAALNAEFADARATLAELRRIANEDVSALREKMEHSSQKLASSA